MNRLGHAMIRPILQAMAAMSLDADGALPVPSGDGRAHAAGPNPDRILMIGGAAVRGLGVSSHDLGLPGQLARRISALTHRGVDVESHGNRQLTLADCLAMLEFLDLGRCDALVLEVGARDAIGQRAEPQWRRELRAVLEASNAVPLVFVFEIPPVPRYVRLPAIVETATFRKIAQLNATTREIVGDFERAEFLPFTPIGANRVPFGSVAMYERWASDMAPRIAPRLDPATHRRRDLHRNETSRQAALDALHVVGSDADERIDQIAQTARDLLGASGASVTFLDHDRQWIKSAVTMSSRDTARASSFCNSTITRPELFVVEDAAADDEFAGHPWVVGEEHVRFYAGYPVEAPNGERVGALCIVDTKPRHLSGAEAALLRELALRVQTLLWAG